jgi:hypothetical protein
VTTDVVPITQKVAADHYALPHAPFERALKPARVDFLQAKALNGLAVPFNWAVGVLKANGEAPPKNGKGRAKASTQVLRINGQHSSYALKELDGKLPEGLVAVITTYELDSIHDAAACFAQHDHRVSMRSIEDVWGAYKDTEPTLVHINRRIAKDALKGYLWYQRHLEGAVLGDEENHPTFYFDQELHPWFLFCGEVLRISDGELRKEPIVAAMYATFVAEPDEAKIFWMEISRGNLYAPEGDPAKALADWYLEVNNPEARPADVVKESYYRAALYAWGAFRAKKSIQGIRYKGKGGLPEAG